MQQWADGSINTTGSYVHPLLVCIVNEGAQFIA